MAAPCVWRRSGRRRPVPPCPVFEARRLGGTNTIPNPDRPCSVFISSYISPYLIPPRFISRLHPRPHPHLCVFPSPAPRDGLYVARRTLPVDIHRASCPFHPSSSRITSSQSRFLLLSVALFQLPPSCLSVPLSRSPAASRSRRCHPAPPRPAPQTNFKHHAHDHHAPASPTRPLFAYSAPHSAPVRLPVWRAS